jgi:hypothetical protein
MTDTLLSLFQVHHAFYEVVPYYVVVEKRHPGVPVQTQRVQAGFEVNIYGVSIKDKLEPPGSDPHYTLAYAELQKVTQAISDRTTDKCSLELVPFHSTAVLDARDHAKVEATLRIRISHGRGLEQPSGAPEEHALEELEKQLKSLGIARR